MALIETCDDTHEQQPSAGEALLSVRQGQSDFRHQKSVNPSLDNMRVLLFITTHVSPAHIEFLQKCWPAVISNSALLQHANVLIFSGGELPSDIVQTVFPDKNVRVERYQNSGYQS